LFVAVRRAVIALGMVMQLNVNEVIFKTCCNLADSSSGLFRFLIAKVSLFKYQFWLNEVERYAKYDENRFVA